jgi:hypothetical protein
MIPATVIIFEQLFLAIGTNIGSAADGKSPTWWFVAARGFFPTIAR